MNKVDYNKKMIGKSVLVQEKFSTPWRGEVVGVVDDENLSIRNSSGAVSTVHIYDVRSIKNEEEVKK
tara:strand:+ start:2583 stop:2783 length:201 start_codon:yes stop_codon:yes gene_type:complete